MYLNQSALFKKDLNKLLAAPQTGGMLDSHLVDQGDQLTLQELPLLWMWKNRLKKRQQPHLVILKKRMRRMNGLKAAGM